MRLPQALEVVVDIEKLENYCLSSTHTRGRHKARVFFAALGITAQHAQELRTALLSAARENELRPGVSDDFGVRYVVDFEWTRKERSAWIRSSWIMPVDEAKLRFVTCFVLPRA